MFIFTCIICHIGHCRPVRAAIYQSRIREQRPGILLRFGILKPCKGEDTMFFIMSHTSQSQTHMASAPLQGSFKNNMLFFYQGVAPVCGTGIGKPFRLRNFNLQNVYFNSYYMSYWTLSPCKGVPYTSPALREQWPGIWNALAILEITHCGYSDAESTRSDEFRGRPITPSFTSTSKFLPSTPFCSKVRCIIEEEQIFPAFFSLPRWNSIIFNAENCLA